MPGSGLPPGRASRDQGPFPKGLSNISRILPPPRLSAARLSTHVYMLSRLASWRAVASSSARSSMAPWDRPQEHASSIAIHMRLMSMLRPVPCPSWRAAAVPIVPMRGHGMAPVRINIILLGHHH